MLDGLWSSEPRSHSRSALTIAGALAFIAAVLLAVTLGTARAAVTPGFTKFSVTPSTTQAGGHPDVEFRFAWTVTGGFQPCEGERCLLPRVLTTHLPTGFIGNPHVIPKCTLTEFNQGACPSDSQVGVADTAFGILVPVYNMETRPEQAGLLGFLVPITTNPVFLELSGRTDSDYGLDVVSSPILQFPLKTVSLFLWGVPADSSHDVLRFKSPLEGGGCGSHEGCPGITGVESSIPSRPYLQSPITCGVPLSAEVELEYYGGTTVHSEAPWPAMTGCSQIAFNPSQTVKPTTRSADTASGLDIDLKVPQPQSPSTPAGSEIRSNTVTLPKGFSINPNAADGKLACSDAETSIGTLFAARCPEFSKVGTASIDVASLPGPIPGALYLGEPKPGQRYRLILTADGFATHVKLIGLVRPDPQTGQLVTVFDQPQSNIQQVSLHFFGSERGLLATPTQCGTYPVRSEFVPWNSALATQTSTTYFTIDSGPGGSPCPSGPRPFAPRMAAGTANNTAGSHAPFTFTLSRSDGEQNLTGLSVRTPPGFSATLKGIPSCPEAAIAGLTLLGYSGLSERLSPACSEASQVGTAVAGAGAGIHPLYVGGKVYLAGPYKGAPLSLLVVVPAVSGPYDLGAVAVRATLEVDRTTAQVTAVSDPLPQILEGVPLRTRFVQVSLDRSNFALNPTNCDPLSVQSTVTGDEGAASGPTAHFQVANCVDLPYGPKLSLKMTGATKRTGHPALSATLTAREDEANTKLAQVTLPHAQFLDTAHLNAPCTRVQFAAGACPASSQVGVAKAVTPLLEEPLEGPVYLRTSNNNLPDLVADLHGRFHVVLVGRVDSVKERIRSSFETAPDVPVSRFTLSFFGGRKGLLVNSENLCKGPQKALVRLRGHNGVAIKANTRIQNPCAKNVKARPKHRARFHAGRHADARRTLR